MATLTLKYKEKNIKIYSLAEDGDTRIGRLAENDIVVDNIAVSGRHARVVPDQFGFLIKDLGSRNGTFVGQHPVETRRLANGDVITIGKHELVFTGEGGTAEVDMRQAARHAQPGETTEKRTAFLDTTKQREMLDGLNRLGRREPLVTIRYKGKVVYKHLLKGVETGIGRDPSNKIVIDNTAISMQHAMICPDGEGFIVRDCNSRNGTFVNEVPVTSHKLQSGDIITIGRHELVFEEQGVFSLEETMEPINKSTASPMYASGTTVINTKKQREMLANDPNAPLPPVLSIIEGGEGEFAVQKKIVTIGKSESSDVVVKGFLVGKNAATLAARPDGYYFNCKKSFVKPRVNGVKLTGSVKLRNSDMIQIGETIIQFNMPT